MLPEYVGLKTRISERLATGLRKDLHEDGVISLVSHVVIHEGSDVGTVTEEGVLERRGFRKVEHSVPMSVEEIEEGGIDLIRAKLAELREAMAQEQHEVLFETITEAVESVGNVVQAGGGPLTAELWLESLEKMELSFDPDGRWRMPTVVVHPKHMDRVRSEMERLESEPELKERLEALVNQKREEWRDRESDRRLVD